ncbi:hypothetical protein [Helicobacter sp. 11S02596-1]|uniref:hypothetical protein n=1 Tax=Helicobacter sp. 11S02596-1 TaxID=1476194 RepID=UPI00117BC1FC|nr:hypothetical protein [Helicobacter sp. 11S02596-1]
MNLKTLKEEFYALIEEIEENISYQKYKVEQLNSVEELLEIATYLRTDVPRQLEDVFFNMESKIIEDWN